MNLTFRAGEKADFARVYRALFSHFQNDESVRAAAEADWNILMSNQDVLCMIVKDTEKPVETRILGCVQTVFVSDAFVQQVKTMPHPCAVQLACAPLPDGSWPLLTRDQVRAANSGKGLNAFTVCFGWDGRLPQEEQQQVRDYMDEKYTLFYRGYQFKELLFWGTGEFAREGLPRAGFLLRNDYAAFFKACGEQREPAEHPYLFGITREEARQRMGALVTRLFAHTPPRFHFKPAEQELLLLAQAGFSDEEIALRLSLGRDAIKKRWGGIYEWVEEQMPSLLPKAEGSVRGQEKRRILLHYLSDHSEEMRPLTPRKSRQGAGSA